MHAPKDPLTDEDAEIDEVNFVFPPETSICKAAAAAAAKWGDYELIENIIQIREKSRKSRRSNDSWHVGCILRRTVINAKKRTTI